MYSRLDKSLFQEANVYCNRIEFYKIVSHNHEFIEFAYVEEGEGIHFLDGKEVPFQAGDYFIINQGVYHRFCSEQKITVYNSVFTPDFLDFTMTDLPDLHSMAAHSFFSSIILKKDFPPEELKFHADEEIRRLFLEMYDEFEGRRMGYLKILQADLMKLIILTFRRMSATDFTIPAQANETYNRIIKYLSTHFAEEVSLCRLADMAYVSKEHFCRSFKRYTGMTLTQFLKKIRIREAERLLLETDLIIGEISRRVGYQDEKHFAKLFRSYLGESPAVFRARHRK